MPATTACSGQFEGFRPNPNSASGSLRPGFAQQQSSSNLPPTSRGQHSSWDRPAASRSHHALPQPRPDPKPPFSDWAKERPGPPYRDWQWGRVDERYQRPLPTLRSVKGPAATGIDLDRRLHGITQPFGLRFTMGDIFPRGMAIGADTMGPVIPNPHAAEYGCYGNGSTNIHFPKLEYNLNSYVCGNERKVSKQKREDSYSTSWVTEMEYSYDNARDFGFSKCRVAEEDRCDERERVHSTDSIFETKAKEALVHDVATSDTEDVTIPTSDLPAIQEEDVHVSKNAVEVRDEAEPVIENPTIIDEAPKKSYAPIAMHLKFLEPISGRARDIHLYSSSSIIRRRRYCVKETYPLTIVPLRPRAKGRKRKNVLKQDESSAVEITVPKNIHRRGHARQSRSSNCTITTERGKHIWDGLPEAKVESATYFDPLWFEMYANRDRRANVLSWIKEKGILSKKCVFVPIVKWSHWSLLIMYNLGQSLDSETNAPCLLLLDSLQCRDPKRLEPSIRRLLIDIYESEERTESKKELQKIPLWIPEMGKDWFTDDQVEYFCKELEALPSVTDPDPTSYDSSYSIEIVTAPSSVHTCKRK
ncbi:hypothetical protein SASPL_126718 [Salvia splendens]|uniref:Ubiquitin-like protease family profile domain-containing protein n=1 Tax=Salvia splendens TaxID=180675 RepID=A0A8X8ZQA5_SALSN|nr:hypothetical protein SASPL_126718 [Salvia splendens]